MTHAAVSVLPVMIAIAEFENPLLDVYGLELAHRIAAARRRAPRFMRLAGHNHISLVAHFNTVEDTLGRRDRGIHTPPGLRPAPAAFIIHGRL